MASHSAAAYALMRHDEMKAAAHGQPKPLPTATFDSQPRCCGSAAPGAEDQAAPQLGEHVQLFTVPEWFAQLLGAASIDLPAARSALAKI